MRLQHFNRGGFALPTVLIASVIMLAVLAFSVSSVMTIRNSLKEQQYEQLAKVAGEAGVAYAKACLAQSGNVPLWTDAKPLTPATDCAGNVVLSPSIEVLAVGGGGGGGGNASAISRAGAGGGAGGGVFYEKSVAVVPGTLSITVGAGGAGGTAAGVTGATTNISGGSVSISAPGGGAGGGILSSGALSAAGNGVSGGGGAGIMNGSAPAYGGSVERPLGTSPEATGSRGGSGSANTTQGNGGGGGGAGGEGGDASMPVANDDISGNGGIGRSASISGSEVFYGAGGSGGRWGAGQVGFPGKMFGGIGANAEGGIGSEGAVNTGAGGGGGGASGGRGGAGGSGVVMILIPKPGVPGANITVSAVTGAHTVKDRGLYRLYTFTSGTASLTISAATSGTCPTDSRCSVVSEPNMRSSFSIKRPQLNGEGKAISIPNTGYVELLRSSNGAVWRTYRQPSVQPAVVPDFCSAATQSNLGWSYVVRTAAQQTIPGAAGSGAQSISLVDADVQPGDVFYRKDFMVSEPGMYTMRVGTPSANIVAEATVSGNIAGRAAGAISSSLVNLGVGCYTAVVKVTGVGIGSVRANFVASLALQNAAPIIASDTTWRVSAGATVDFSSPDFNEIDGVWSPVTPFGASLTNFHLTRGGMVASGITSEWDSGTNDPFTQVLTACDSGDVTEGRCNSGKWSYFRAGGDFVLTAETTVTISATCNRECDVYIGGENVLKAFNTGSIPQKQTITLAPGTYRTAMRVHHGVSSGVPPASIFAASVRASYGTILARTDYSWQVSKDKYDTNSAIIPYSYEASYIPSPIFDLPKLDAILVGGGGGGGANSAGGGGGGSVLLAKGIDPLDMFVSKNIVIGGGGAGAPNTGSRGVNGGNTTLGTYVAMGGGGGASRDNGPAPGVGGTGGGGSGTTSSGAGVRDLGALGTYRIGWAGGSGTPSDQGAGSKGGGGGGATGPGRQATTAVAGNGGPGYLMYVGSTRRAVGGGGGGGLTASNGAVGIATDGGVSGLATTPAAAASNSGGGGGGGSSGGAGGSGIVVIRYSTDAFNAAGMQGVGGTITTYGGYTYHTFTANGSFWIGWV